MRINVLKAKIKRKNLEEYAGRYFRNETSQIIHVLAKEGKKAFFGIERDDGVYTLIGEQFVYYSTAPGEHKKLSLKTFSEELHSNGMSKKGKSALGNFFYEILGRYKILNRYEFIKISNEEIVWLHNESTMCALWNIVLWLEKVGNEDF